MIGVLMMAYGGPNNLDEVAPYLSDVRGGRPTSAEVLAETVERYRQIGGSSPILRLTRAQAAALEAELNRDGGEYRVMVGMRHWHPYIRETLAEMHKAGIREAVGLVMAPQYSRMSVEVYFQRAAEAEVPVKLARIEDWHTLPGYLDALAARVRRGLEAVPADRRERAHVLFTAHSLPQRILQWDDPYPRQLAETVAGVLDRLGAVPHSFAYQSAGRTPEPWLGPSAAEAIAALAEQGVRDILVAPVGFVCEHVEILYDIDVEMKQQAARLGIALQRIDLVNADPGMIAGLAELVRRTYAHRPI